MDIQNGYLFITDITGYTEFLTQSELDHAKEIEGKKEEHLRPV